MRENYQKSGGDRNKNFLACHIFSGKEKIKNRPNLIVLGYDFIG